MTFEHEVSIVEIYRRCRQSQHFNYNASRYYMKWNNRLVRITIIFSCLVVSAIFYQIVDHYTSVQSAYSLYITYAAGAVSLLVTILSILQMIFNFSELSERGNRISARYGNVRRELELLLSQKAISESELKIKMNSINYFMTCLAEDSPRIPIHIQEKVKKELKNKPITNPLIQDVLRRMQEKNTVQVKK